MAITGRPRPLPECRGGCGRALRRTRAAVTGGYCSDCMTTTQKLAATHREHHLARLAADTTSSASRRAEERINRLAAKRQARLVSP